ncbi:MAG: O-sialoglycoprotein endopeptidase [bacterium]|nr:O-sialoglycoprotein endopeptidase [bacterium]
MTQIVVGLDTSCYTTSCAAVTVDGRVIASCRKLLPVAAGERGLRQSEAVFAHVRQLPERMEELGRAIQGMEIVAVCTSVRPRDDCDSYMPVFQVGDAQSRALAAMLGVPCFASTHQRGHIAAAAVDSGIRPGDLLAVHLSGGTTELLCLQGEQLTLLGGTLDLHAGQVVDRTGVALGLPFPSGPYLEACAQGQRPKALLPVSMAENDLSCHFSGAESQLQRWIAAQSIPREQIAIEVYDLIARTLSRMICAGAEKTGVSQVLIAGGVSSSALLRQMLRDRISKRNRRIHVCFGKPEYSGDNAVGTALLGARAWQKLECSQSSHEME